MAQSQSDDGAAEAESYDYAVDHTIDESDAIDFTESALGNVVAKLQSNLGEARAMGKDGGKTVAEVLDPENVREIQVRARPLENPKITVWLKDAPIWANDAWRDYIYPHGLNAYNGKVTTSFDVRPF